MKTFICQFCQKEYTSDGSSKPLKYKNGLISKYYKSSRFCSPGCAEANRKQEFKKTISTSEFHDTQSRKISNIWKNRSIDEVESIHKKIQKTRNIDKFKRSFQKTIQSRTEEDRQRIHKNCKKAHIYTKEKKEYINNKIRQTKLKNIDRFKEGIEKMKRAKANKTPEELSDILRKRRITWASKTQEEKQLIKAKEVETKRSWTAEFKENFRRSISNSLKEFHAKYPEKVEEMKRRNKIYFNTHQELIDHIKEKGAQTKLRHFKTALKISIDDFKSRFNGNKQLFLNYLKDLYQDILDKKVLVSGHSPDEILFYINLLNIFNYDDICFPFKLNKYEYDFLIQPLNAVVELNIYPTHGLKEFNKDCLEDLTERDRLINNYNSLNYIDRLKLRIWANWDYENNRSYEGASDINKKMIALDNGFTFKALYNKREIDEFLEELRSIS